MTDEKKTIDQESKETTKVESDSTRRKTLKRMLIAGGAVAASDKVIPEKWSKPAIDSVLIPAHAQTTTPSSPGGG